MGVWAHGSQFAGYDYVQTSEPVDPEEGEMWYDLDNDRSLAYTGTEWQQLNIIDHGQLAGIVADAHHAWPVPTGGIADDAISTAKVAADAVTNALIAADAVDTDQIATDAVTAALIANGAVDTSQLAADAVTATEVADNETLPVDISGDADSVDGYEGADLQTPASTAQSEVNFYSSSAVASGVTCPANGTADVSFTGWAESFSFEVASDNSSTNWAVRAIDSNGDSIGTGTDSEGPSQTVPLYEVPGKIEYIELTDYSGNEFSIESIEVSVAQPQPHAHQI